MAISVWGATRSLLIWKGIGTVPVLRLQTWLLPISSIFLLSERTRKNREKKGRERERPTKIICIVVQQISKIFCQPFYNSVVLKQKHVILTLNLPNVQHALIIFFQFANIIFRIQLSIPILL